MEIPCINKVIYLSIYPGAGRSLAVKGGGGSHFEKAENIF